MLFDTNEINQEQRVWKISIHLYINNILLNSKWVKEVSRKKYFELNKNIQNLSAATKVVHRGKIIALNGCYKRRKVSKK